MTNRNDFYVSPRISKKALNTFLSHFKAGGDELHTLEIYEHDALLVRLAPAPYHCTDKREIYSLSKSFCSTAIGFLIDEGKLSEDDRIVDLFPDKCPAVISENLAKMCVRHVLSMNTGHAACVMPKMIEVDDAAKAFLAQEVAFEPGTHFTYNTGATCMLSCIVEKLSGMKLLDFLSWKLFMPLGIDEVRWNRTADGTNEGGCGIHVSADDIAKLGLLYKNGGIWNGKRLLSEHWVKTATSPISDNSCNGTPDWCAGYGYQFWVNAREGFRGDGAFGQLCVVLPEHDMVFALQTELGNMQAEMDWLMELADHIHDGDGELVPVLLPDYSVPRSAQKTTGMENAWYKLDENPMGFTGMTMNYDTENDEMRVVFSGGVDQYVIRAGNGVYAESTVYTATLKPKLVGLMNTDIPERCRMAAAFEAQNGQLLLRVRYLNCPHRMEITVSADGDAIAIHFESWGKLRPGASDIKGTKLS